MRYALAILIAALLALPAEARQRRNYDESEPPDPQQLKVQNGKPLIDFVVPDLAGNNVKTADLRKDKILIIHVSNTKTEGHRGMLAALKQISQKYKDVVVLDVISKDPSKPEELIQYYELININVNIIPAVDTDGKVPEALGMLRYPLVLVIDKAGNVAFITEGLEMAQVDWIMDRITK